MRKIAIIDDQLPNALLIKGYAERLADVEASVFTDPIRALDWCVASPPDLVLLDYVMPEMDGGAFLFRMRETESLKDVPVIVITAEESRETLYRVLEFDTTDFLRKPVDDLELIARARNMLRLRARQVALAAANDRLYELAATDALTGLASRRHFLERLESEMERSRRNDRPLCLAMFDCDYFKRINDVFGHDAGDEVLKALAKLLIAQLRKGDLAGRLGGEEYAVLMTETQIPGARLAVERLLAMIRKQEVAVGGHRIRYTVSVGLSRARPDSDTVGSLLKRSDLALYDAKNSGRDRFSIADTHFTGEDHAKAIAEAS